MSPTRQKQRTTLSDLLAEDVRDYFLREGVADHPSEHTPPPSTRRARGSSSKKGAQQAFFQSPSSSSASSSGGGSRLAVWATTPSSTTSPTAPYTPIGQVQEKPIRLQHYLTGESERFSQIQKQNGHSTAERQTSILRGMQQHRRHSSGSGSFHSRGSASTASRSKYISVADAEFLRRYAEEKERANIRMLGGPRTNFGSNGMVNTSMPLDVVDGISNDVSEESSRGLSCKPMNRTFLKTESSSRPYRSLHNSTRPPTVTGSHRPGLASIDNDDWEEDDRIERRDKRKMERKEAKKIERHLQKASSIGGDSSVASGSVVETQQSLYHQYQGYNSQGSVMGGSVGLTPGSGSSTLCYSSASSQQITGLPWSAPHIHSRVDSTGTFVRKMSSGSTLEGLRESPQDNGTMGNSHGTRNVWPLSYLSASSDSDKSGGTFPEGHFLLQQQNGVNDEILRGVPTISPRQDKTVSSSSYALTPSTYSSDNTTLRNNPSSKDCSELRSSLFGSSILSPGESSVQQARVDPMNAMEYPHRQGEEESTDGSYESDSSSENSYTSGSYDGDSSDSSDTHFHSGRNEDYNRVTWERVKSPQRAHLEYRDAERGEREGLVHRTRTNYASTETHRIKPNQKDRGRKWPKQKRLGGAGGIPLRLDDAVDVIFEKAVSGLLVLELFISNMPSLVGSLALAWGSIGIDWFKWYEETFDTCHPVDYHNQLCVYPEFPGCFACETGSRGYQFVLHFHFLCNVISFILAFCLIGKIMIAFPVVRDELANPTTAAPLGLLCMALEKCFGGNFGYVGMCITFLASALQTAVAVWFIFISVVYKTLPEPSWFPNTVGVGLAAAKVYLYWSLGGYFLGGLSFVAFMMFYFVALYRIHTNAKISAPVCWVQLSGPAVILYGFTIFGQPGSDEEELSLMIPENKEHFFSIHRHFYMPVMHFFFVCCVVSMVSALYCLKTRWKPFREKEFSPAHISFCAPLASHSNAMQAYRSALNKYSSLPPKSVFKVSWCCSPSCSLIPSF
eukprot:g3230.t1.1.5e174189 g3230  g3230.t1 contig12:1666290-1669497(-)